MLTVKQVKDRLNLSRSSVYALIDSGELKSYRLGAGRGAIRVSEKQLEDFLRSRESGGASVPPVPLKLKNLSL